MPVAVGGDEVVWCSSQSSRLTAVLWLSRNRLHFLIGQWLAMVKLPRSRRGGMANRNLVAAPS